MAQPFPLTNAIPLPLNGMPPGVPSYVLQVRCWLAAALLCSTCVLCACVALLL
jgi:hypothetical protein